MEAAGAGNKDTHTHTHREMGWDVLEECDRQVVVPFFFFSDG